MPKLRRIVGRRNTSSHPTADTAAILSSASSADRQIVERALPYTMTGVPRLLAVVDSVRYCVRRGVSGAFAECGVWRGGSILAMILTLQDFPDAERDIYLYDTFEGMTEPGPEDVSDLHGSARQVWRQAERENRRAWDETFDSHLFSEESVRSLLLSTGYPSQRLHFVRGPVEETLPSASPEELALLRLDTDWYKSTYHELVHLFPRLQTGGVLIIDDYGHWHGARRAVDEYFASEHPPVLMSRIDYTGRIAVKH